MTPYTKEYFVDALRSTSERTAKKLVPFIVDLTTCSSVIDVGCGDGSWLKEFEANGVSDYFGIDGDYVDRTVLRIPEDHFIAHDLKTPLNLNRTFELVISLEVAEHLSEAHSEIFIDSLTRLAPIVLFSAAIPGQGGEMHLNEQWQSYWCAKFEKLGYMPVDLIRPFLWNQEGLGFWYQQNTLLYVKPEILEANSRISEGMCRTNREYLDIVHPENFKYHQMKHETESSNMRILLPKAVDAFKKSIARRLRK